MTKDEFIALYWCRFEGDISFFKNYFKLVFTDSDSYLSNVIYDDSFCTYMSIALAI